MKNFVAFSNRAMAYLKMKEYLKAEVVLYYISLLVFTSLNCFFFSFQIDSSCALSIEPSHCKSLQRRATARNALGKHRAALIDLLSAQNYEPAK
jgi:hypothetical protein